MGASSSIHLAWVALWIVPGCSLARGTLGASEVDGGALDDAYAVPDEDSGVDSSSPPQPDGGHGACGDGVITPGETCDDANTRDGDGCSADCQHVENGFYCMGAPSACTTMCGDGIRAGAEACDGGPGCTSCTVEVMQLVAAGPGLGLAIADDHYDGTLGSTTCVNLAAMQFPRDRIASVEASVGMRHTYIGDLTMKLVSPTGTVVTLMSRPGTVETADDGSGMGGDSSNLDTSYPITFVDGAPTSSEDMGLPLNQTGVVCKDDPTCSFAPSHGAAVAGNLTTFVGEVAHGTWRFCVGDGAGGDTGTVDRVSITLRLD